jgi:hypothetical protein
MQIDDRFWGRFCSGGQWKDPEANVDFGARVLSGKRSYIEARATLIPADLEAAAIAAYNCGEGRVVESIEAGEDVDTHTTGRDYSADVLRLAGMYKRSWTRWPRRPFPSRRSGRRSASRRHGTTRRWRPSIG